MMKAILHKKYGSTGNLSLEAIDRPVPKANQVLIKIMATGVNSWDGDMVVGRPLLYRLLFGIFTPRYRIIGCDVAGVVKAIGEEVTRFKPGDRVFGDLSDVGWGGFAEYVATSESAITFIPDAVSFAEAAAIPQAGLLALQSLRYNGKVKPGDQVLFNGAGGGVGTIGLQLAKKWGAEVTVVDHPDKLEKLKALGADHLIDYTRTDYTQTGPYDLIIDVVAQKPFSDYKKAVKPGGGMAIVGGKVSVLLKAVLAIIGGKLATLLHIGFSNTSRSGKTDKKMGIMGQEYRLEDLDYLVAKVASGELMPIIGQTYSLPDTPQAIQAIIDGTAFGKIVINIGDQNYGGSY